jgi:hypothetical protein
VVVKMASPPSSDNFLSASRVILNLPERLNIIIVDHNLCYGREQSMADNPNGADERRADAASVLFFRKRRSYEPFKIYY